MITLGEASVVQHTEVNWNIVVQYLIGGGVLVAALGGIWDRIRKNFASKEELDALRTEVNELRINQATFEKLNGKLDQVLLAIDRKRRSND